MYLKTVFNLFILIMKMATLVHCKKLQIPHPTKSVQNIKVIPPNIDYEKEDVDNLQVSDISITH